MVTARKQYRVLTEFNLSNKEIQAKEIRPAIVTCLSLLHKDEIISPTEFVNKHGEKIIGSAGNELSKKRALNILYISIQTGLELGILEKYNIPPMSMEDFLKIDTVEYFQSQLRGLKCKNLTVNHGTTRSVYLSNLYNFNNWLIGKKFEFSRIVPIGVDSFKKERSEVMIENIEHFLKLYQQSVNSEVEYIKVIKKYLMDSQKHEHKKASTMIGIASSIRAYFDKNDSELKFKFEPVNHESSTKTDTVMSLDDVYKLLTVGRPTITQKAVLLCKFHRGLDTLTLCDQFNFKVWDQLVSYFETDNYMKWDIKKCPVPITLVRIKTNFKHTGFLDVDAIQAIQDYLKHREKTGNKINNNMPLFLTQKNKPIEPLWVRRSFMQLGTISGLREKLPEYHYGRYNIDSHEVRDLLKSTLIACGTRHDVADHVIGHMPKDSYEKQSELYPEGMRSEYMKASHKINIFSNVTNYLNGNIESLEVQRARDELESYKKNMDRREHENETKMEKFERNQKLLFTLLNLVQNDIHKSTEKEREKYKPLLEELKLYID